MIRVYLGCFGVEVSIVKSVSDSYKSYLEKGFTLIEVFAVIVPIGILGSLAVPAVGHLIENAEADVCDVNRSEVSRLYHNHLVLESVEHSDVLFMQFREQFSDTCPIGGNYGLVDGEVVCDLHQIEGVEDSDEDDSGDGGVPFL